MKLNKYWFKPKKFGYGATPTTIEGWLLIFIYLVTFYLLVYYFIALEKKLITYTIYLVLFSFILIFISNKKTKEKWAWRWNNKITKKNN